MLDHNYHVISVQSFIFIIENPWRERQADCSWFVLFTPPLAYPPPLLSPFRQCSSTLCHPLHPSIRLHPLHWGTTCLYVATVTLVAGKKVSCSKYKQIECLHTQGDDAVANTGRVAWPVAAKLTCKLQSEGVSAGRVVEWCQLTTYNLRCLHAGCTRVVQDTSCSPWVSPSLVIFGWIVALRWGYLSWLSGVSCKYCMLNCVCMNCMHDAVWANISCPLTKSWGYN